MTAESCFKFSSDFLSKSSITFRSRSLTKSTDFRLNLAEIGITSSKSTTFSGRQSSDKFFRYSSLVRSFSCFRNSRYLLSSASASILFTRQIAGLDNCKRFNDSFKDFNKLRSMRTFAIPVKLRHKSNVSSDKMSITPSNLGRPQLRQFHYIVLLWSNLCGCVFIFGQVVIFFNPIWAYWACFSPSSARHPIPPILLFFFHNTQLDMDLLLMDLIRTLNLWRKVVRDREEIKRRRIKPSSRRDLNPRPQEFCYTGVCSSAVLQLQRQARWWWVARAHNLLWHIDQP